MLGFNFSVYRAQPREGMTYEDLPFPPFRSILSLSTPRPALPPGGPLCHRSSCPHGPPQGRQPSTASGPSACGWRVHSRSHIPLSPLGRMDSRCCSLPLQLLNEESESRSTPFAHTGSFYDHRGWEYQHPMSKERKGKLFKFEVQQLRT